MSKYSQVRKCLGQTRDIDKSIWVGEERGENWKAEEEFFAEQREKDKQSGG